MSCHSLCLLRKIMNLSLYTCSLYFPLCPETISYTSFPMINCYSLIIASFIARNVSINDVTQLEWVRGLLLWFGSPVILFFILNYLSCPRWSSSLEVDLLFSLGHIMILYILLKLFFRHGVFDPGTFRFLFMYVCWSKSSSRTVVACSSEQVSSFFFL